MKPSYFLLLIFSITLMGCAGMEVKKDMTKNTLYTKGYPKIRIKINPEIKFNGEKREEYLSPAAGGFILPVETSDYYFIKSDSENILKKIVFITFDKVY